MHAPTLPTTLSGLDLVNLTRLMAQTAGRPEVLIGLIDGPVSGAHFVAENIKVLAQARTRGSNSGHGDAHGTFIAGMLTGKRGTAAPAICPGCTLLVRPIFLEAATGNAPSAKPQDLANAIVDCVEAGARVLNLSLELAAPSPNEEPNLKRALDYAAARGTLVVVAAGNQGTVGSSAITRHPWVIPVVACDLAGRPIQASNLSGSIARRGLMAPGGAVTSLSINGQPVTGGGTSVATPFVTGTIALLLSLIPDVSAAETKSTIVRSDVRRVAIVPPLLDAWSAYEMMARRLGSGSHV